MKVTKQSIAVSLLAIGLVTTAGAGITAASTDGGFKGFGGNRGGHAEISASLLGISVDEFQTRVANGEDPREMLEAAGITKEDIKSAREVQMHERLVQAVQNGKLTQEQADEMIARKEQHKARHEAVRVALENNDYDAWLAAVDGTPMADNVDQATFAKLVEAHTLHEAGDHDAARTMTEELGLEPHGKFGFHGRKGPHHDGDETNE